MRARVNTVQAFQAHSLVDRGARTLHRHLAKRALPPTKRLVMLARRLALGPHCSFHICLAGRTESDLSIFDNPLSSVRNLTESGLSHVL
jgi:hypothetical protein